MLYITVLSTRRHDQYIQWRSRQSWCLYSCITKVHLDLFFYRIACFSLWNLTTGFAFFHCGHWSLICVFVSRLPTLRIAFYAPCNDFLYIVIRVTLRSCQFLGAMKHIISKPYIQNAGGSCNDFLEALLPLSSQIQTYWWPVENPPDKTYFCRLLFCRVWLLAFYEDKLRLIVCSLN